MTLLGVCLGLAFAATAGSYRIQGSHTCLSLNAASCEAAASDLGLTWGNENDFGELVLTARS